MIVATSDWSDNALKIELTLTVTLLRVVLIPTPVDPIPYASPTYILSTMYLVYIIYVKEVPIPTTPL